NGAVHQAAGHAERVGSAEKFDSNLRRTRQADLSRSAHGDLIGTAKKDEFSYPSAGDVDRVVAILELHLADVNPGHGKGVVARPSEDLVADECRSGDFEYIRSRVGEDVAVNLPAARDEDIVILAHVDRRFGVG